jgi:hypothetical protein
MSWNMEGLHVEATYLEDFKVSGVVVESRVRYGGTVCHTIVLDKPLHMRWRQEPAERVIIDHETITRVREAA